MRKNWLLIGIGLLVGVLAIGAIACSDDDDDGDNGDNGSVDIFQLVATLTEMDSSGATGVADISVNGEGILVQIVMEGLEEGVHANHIHHGTCASQGEVHITLDNIVADAAGDGSQITNNTELPLSHYETGHYVAVHVAGGDPGAVVSCGDVVIPDA